MESAELAAWLRWVGEPSPGSEVTDRLLVGPLLDHGVVTPEAVADAWMNLLVPEIVGLLTSEADHVSFDEDIHPELTRVTARRLIVAGLDTQDAWTALLDKAFVRAEGTVRGVWARARDYDRWFKATIGLTWLSVLLTYIRLEAQNQGVPLTASLEALCQRSRSCAVAAQDAAFPDALFRLSAALLAADDEYIL